MHPNSKEEKKCIRCKKIFKRNFFANWKYWDCRDFICYYCILEKKNKNKLSKRKEKNTIDKKKSLNDLKIMMDETKKITWFSEKFIKKLLTKFTHNEIRTARIENWKILIKQLY
jgi:hypothetical protein